MKKKISILIVVLSLFCVLVLSLGCIDYSELLQYEEVIVNDEVIGYSVCEINIERNIYNNTRNDTVTKINIPSTYKDKPVVTIGMSSLRGLMALKEVIIPDSVTKIDVGAFIFCENLEKITISKNIQDIGQSSFHDCFALKDIYFNGSAEDWEKVNIANGNEPLLNATIHFEN